MKDPHGRAVDYLRLSLTGACSMRCVYCRPAGVAQSQTDEPLNPKEIEDLVRHLVTRHGLRKVRLTGGEPTCRQDLLEIIARLASIPGLTDLAMTTNGLTLRQQATALKAAGLHRLNISLDSLDPATFARMTGSGKLPDVISGIDAAIAVGFAGIKLNTVVLRGSNEHELAELVRFAACRQLEIRFIELMPIGPLQFQWASCYVSADEMRAGLEPFVHGWAARAPNSAAARRYDVVLDTGERTTIGFITAMSCPFCSHCNRVRIGSDGRLYPCLMDKPAMSLLPAIRPRFNPDTMDLLLESGLASKSVLHPATGPNVMTTIGG